MAHPSGAGSRDNLRLDFDRRVRLEFRGSQLSSDGGLLIVRELDDALGLSNLASAALADNRTGANRVHQLAGLFRQAVYGRLAGYEDVNDADSYELRRYPKIITSNLLADQSEFILENRSLPPPPIFRI